MPRNEELLTMKSVGVLITAGATGWGTTIFRKDEKGQLHPESWPTRSRFSLALADAKRFAPNVRYAPKDAHCSWVRAMCERGLMPLSYGETIAS